MKIPILNLIEFKVATFIIIHYLNIWFEKFLTRFESYADEYIAALGKLSTAGSSFSEFKTQWGESLQLFRHFGKYDGAVAEFGYTNVPEYKRLRADTEKAEYRCLHNFVLSLSKIVASTTRNPE